MDGSFIRTPKARLTAVDNSPATRTIEILSHAMPHRPLAPDEIARRHTDVPGWSVSGACLTLTATFPSFADAIDFVNEVARLAEKADHHPDIDVRHRTVKLSLTTHSAGGLTEADFALARLIDTLQD